MAQSGAGASKITVEEEEPRIRQLQGVPKAEGAMVAVCERGPVGVATLATSFPEWQRLFGADIANGDGSHGARGFFEEGGQVLWTVRTVHYTDIATPATKTSASASGTIQTGATSPFAGTVLGTNIAPFDLEPGDTLLVDIDGAGALTATFTATRPARATSGAGTYALNNGDTITVDIDGEGVQTIEFLTAEFAAIGAATRGEVADVINAKLVGGSAVDTGTTVEIRSDRRGTGASVNVTGGTANGVLGFTTGLLAGTGNVANIDAVTAAEIETVVEAAVAGAVVTSVGGAIRISSSTTGVLSSVQVGASSTADDELGLDNATHSGGTGAAQNTLTTSGRTDGTYANAIATRVSDASSGIASEFNFDILRSGVVVERYPNVTMDPEAPRYIETIVNDLDTGSPLVTVLDLGLAGTPTENRPINGTSAVLSGGDDGLTGLVDNDFVGSPTGKTGLYGLDLVEDARLLFVPGRATSAVQNAMISYAEVVRGMSMIPIFDPPAGSTAQSIITYVETTASLLEASEFGAMFWPRVKVLNPNRSVFGAENLIVVPPSGIVAGVIARGTNTKGGIYKPAAGIERGRMLSVLGFETDETLDEKKRDLVFPKRINPLTTGRGKPRFIDGARTLKSTGNFPYLSERLGVIYIEQTIKRGIEFARHQNNSEGLRAVIVRSIKAFLRLEMKDDAFRSKDPNTAFLVDFGEGLNPPSLVFAGRMLGRVGLATNKPAEFINLLFSQDTRALEAELAA